MNDFHLLQSWTPQRGKELTKRQAKRMIKQLKVSELRKFTVEFISKDKHESNYAKISLAIGKKPQTPNPTIPQRNSRMLVPHDQNYIFEQSNDGQAAKLKYRNTPDWYSLVYNQQTERTNIFNIDENQWVAWRDTLIFRTKDDKIKKVDLSKMMKANNKDGVVESVSKDHITAYYIHCVDNKTGDVYYNGYEGGPWRNEKNIIHSKGDFTVNIDEGGIFISEFEYAGSKSGNDPVSAILIYEMKKADVELSQTIPIGSYEDYFVDHMWTTFKGLGICAVLNQKNDYAIISLYAFHKKSEPVLIKTLQIEKNKDDVKWRGIFEICLITRRNILDVVCCYQSREL